MYLKFKGSLGGWGSVMIVGCDLVLTIAFRHILYTNIDQTLLNK